MCHRHTPGPLLPPTQSHHTLSSSYSAILLILHSRVTFTRIWGTVIRHCLSATSKPGARGTANRNSLVRDSTTASFALPLRWGIISYGYTVLVLYKLEYSNVPSWLSPPSAINSASASES